MPVKKPKASFSELVDIMHTLRAPGGCPWDREQTHGKLLKYLREESGEVARAVRRKDWANLEEELGDLLLQVLFHAELAHEAGRFSIQDVMGTLKSKLIRRHPHVFGKAKGKRLSASDVLRNWNRIKAAEKRQKWKVKRVSK